MSHVQSTRRLNAAPRNVARAAALLCASLAMPYSAPLMAADTAIENEPLATRPASKAKPNLMVILDDSGSMNWSYMPDSLGASNNTTDEPYSSWYGYRTSQCNGVAYDPSTTYTPPIKADGNSYGNASYPKAKTDGYVSNSGTVDLSDHVFYTYKGTQDKMGWTYTADKKSPVNNDFYKECSSTVGDDPGKSVFTQHKVSDLSAAEKTNYANWFSYYRKRYLLMRTAMGRAIFGLNDGYRVGFTAINDDNNFIQSNSSTFVNVDDFTVSHKTRLFKSLYGIGPGGGTPLRQALANTGRYFAKKHANQKDPMTLSCQRNYALLTTDGYWNGSNGTKLDDTSIGQEDGSEARPMSDATSLNLKVVTTYEVIETRNQTTTSTWFVPGQRTKTTVSNKAEKSGDYKGQYKVTTQVQSSNKNSYGGTKTKTVITPQQRTYTRTITITKYEDGTESTPSVVDTGNTDTAWQSGTAGEASWSDIAENTNNNNWSDFGAPTYTYQTQKGSGLPVYSNYEATGEGSQSGSASTTYGTASQASVTQKGDPKTTPETTGGASPTLADVAQYYWATDLRNGTNCDVTVTAPDGTNKTVNVCINNVPSSTADPAKYQHLNTFGIGLGVNGTLKSSDFADLKTGKKTWPSPFNNEGAVRIDDLWHAAVNGRGEYYSALSASALSSAIAGVIAKIDEVNGASSAAATSALELVAGDNNLLYSASYTTGAWTGDLAAYVLTGETGEASKIKKWSSQALLDAQAYTGRKIYIKSGTTSLALFTYDNLSTTQKAHFDKICDQPSAPSQCASLQPKAKAAANLGANLVNYLRGDRTYEADVGFKEDPNSDTVTPATLYRPRDHVLGDIINGAPVYVGQPPFKYADTGYADFKATSRTAMVYAAANDGMLHAFDANSGEEQWAYIPSAVIPNLYKLADTNYAGKHQYFVDGAPVMGDIKVGTEWKTILVGGLNKGGKAYYALDITNPASPKLLWEFTHSNLGLTYGNPVITKNAAGTWIVAFGSGYNNNEGSGDGKGRLFIVNANTGAEIVSGGIATSEGTDTAPSGMAKINAWIEDASDNTATRFYGADLEGNVWRFDYEGLVEPKNKAFKLGTLTVSGTPQPITTKPLLLQSGGKPVVIVGTGRYLGEADITDATVQSIYAIKDPLTDSGWGNIRANASFVKQTFTLNNAAKTATISKNPVNWSTNAGWWVDLPHEKERISTPMSLQLTTLVIPSTIPSGDNCKSGGSSWMYYLNAASGSVINKDTVGSEVSPDSLIVGTGWFADSEGNLRLSRQNSQGDRDTVTPPVAGSGGSGNAHRTSWRELID